MFVEKYIIFVKKIKSMKSFVIEIEDRDENALIEILRRFAIKIHPAQQGTIKKAKIEPKTVADFLQVSHTLTAWDDDLIVN